MKSQTRSNSANGSPERVSDLPEAITQVPKIESIKDVRIPEPKKDPVADDDLEHRDFDDTRFWSKIPAFHDVSREEFLDFKFQNKQSATSVKDLRNLLKDITSDKFLDDVELGMQIAPMNMRISPYILSLINWKDPYNDPLRIQFIPVASSRLLDHPKLSLDSLHEQDDSPTPGLVHRYIDKVLFLPLDVCPVYCRFCTRSYAIGSDSGEVEKVDYKPIVNNWEKAFAYIASRPEIEDVVVSGGDAYMLPAKRLRFIGEMLLAIPHIRRIRFASKGPAIMPMKILTDHPWTNTLVDIVEKGRKMHKEVVLHTHFNSANEITDITRDAMNLLFEKGVKVRNQSVLIRNVNDDADDMINLVRQLSYMNVQPYYVYQHDMVKGVEEMRTRVADTVEIERYVRGTTAGFNTPTFVMDAPGGGGKRDVHSYDYYDETTGVSVYRSPSVDEEKVYLYFDPIDRLPEAGQKRWADESQHDKIVEEAIEAANLTDLKPALSL